MILFAISLIFIYKGINMMEDVNKLILNKIETEEAIGEAIAVVYRIEQFYNYADNIRYAIKPDQFKNYVINKNNKYLIVTSKSFYSIDNGILKKVHPFE